ncbi:MAG: chemotaxis response regulator protein-glutamate methylesterase [Candidatus Riflebacteria bacterium]|nr:chemotaxis response regulator protein-glutamate methylesterase [Candidatus Riflebacteria bacterium]
MNNDQKKVIKLLIVDDSAFMRAALERMLKDEPDISVIASASNGKEAIEKAMRLRPDVITLDIEMPVMDGLQALRELMRMLPLPVIMLSGLTQQGARAAFQALELGAVDFIGKPGSGLSLNIFELKEQLLTKIRTAASSSPQPGKIFVSKEGFHHNNSNPGIFSPDRLIVIGASTGGPPAIETLLSTFPAIFSASIVIAQHMPPVFTNALAQRLNSICKIKVKEALDGEILQNSIAYICPGGLQTKIVKLSNGNAAFQIFHEPREKCRFSPTIDLLFESGLNVYGRKCLGVILTGMGEDGVAGLRKIYDAGGLTIVQDKTTSVVFGMPKAAAEAGAASRVLPITEIAHDLILALNS